MPLERKPHDPRSMETDKPSKKWWESKTIWFNVLLTVLELSTAFMESNIVPELMTFFMMTHLIGNVILRVWFTDKPIS